MNWILGEFKTSPDDFYREGLGYCERYSEGMVVIYRHLLEVVNN